MLILTGHRHTVTKLAQVRIRTNVRIFKNAKGVNKYSEEVSEKSKIDNVNLASASFAPFELEQMFTFQKTRNNGLYVDI